MYQDAIDQIHAAGFHPTIENEIGPCIFSTPDEVIDFFQKIGRSDKACFTWDVQNLWQLGTFPTLEIYQKIKPLIGYYHVKGGQAEDDNTSLAWASPLENASWPVLDITRKVIHDGLSPVICLNGSHGRRPDGYDQALEYKRDIHFLKSSIGEIA